MPLVKSACAEGTVDPTRTQWFSPRFMPFSRARYRFTYGGAYGERLVGTTDIEPFGEDGEPICSTILG